MGVTGWAFVGAWAVGFVCVCAFMRGASGRSGPQAEYEKRRIKVWIYARRAQPWDKTADEFVIFLAATKGMGLAGTLVGETTVEVVVPTQAAIEQHVLLNERLRNNLIDEGYRA